LEQKLEVKTNGNFKNIDLKPKLHKGIKGLDNGNHIVVEMMFKEGLKKDGQYGPYYIMKVLYDEQEVSFFLNEKEHDNFAAVGEVGDKVKITLIKEDFINKKTGVESKINKLVFSRV
jgi:hypothetical protein